VTGCGKVEAVLRQELDECCSVVGTGLKKIPPKFQRT
jgi:hypothetical protein